jgi:hypothetical protein
MGENVTTYDIDENVDGIRLSNDTNLLQQAATAGEEARLEPILQLKAAIAKENILTIHS